MPKTRNVYLEGTKIKSMCRVCLTQSNIMYKLTDKLKREESIPSESYLEALQRATFARVELNGNYPERICPMCVSFLKMALQFLTLFKESQKKLKDMFKFSTPAFYGTASKPDDEDGTEPISKLKKELDCYDESPVELIVKDQKYSLKDLVVVEETEVPDHDYKGFINKLGKEISATIVTNNTCAKKKKTAVQIETDDDAENTETEYQEGNVTIKEENEEQEYDAPIEEENESNEEEDNYQEDAANEEYNDSQEEDAAVEEDNDSQEEDGAVEGDNGEVIEYVIEEQYSDDDDENVEYITMVGDNNEGQENVENEANGDSSSRNYNSENDNMEYLEIDMLDKEAIESLIIDRENLKEGEELSFVRPQRRRRRNAPPAVPKDEFEKEVQFPCGTCKKIFPKTRALRIHIRKTHMEKNEKAFTCEICGTICRTRSKFVNHKLKHFEKQFKCELCEKVYSTKAHLKVHMNVHANTRPYLCTVCGKDFNYANALTYHMRLHTGEKNYHCEYCPKQFRMINSLNRHVRTHTGEKPYECQYCSRHFSSKGEVVCHEYIHTGYRPYHCKHCKKGFSKTHNLKIHLLSHRGSFHCKFCNKTFIEENILSMHHKISHKDLMTEIKNEENNESTEGSQDEEIQFDRLDGNSNMEYHDADEDDVEITEVVLVDDDDDYSVS